MNGKIGSTIIIQQHASCKFKEPL